MRGRKPKRDIKDFNLLSTWKEAAGITRRRSAISLQTNGEDNRIRSCAGHARRGRVPAVRVAVPQQPVRLAASRSAQHSGSTGGGSTEPDVLPQKRELPAAANRLQAITDSTLGSAARMKL